MTETENQNYNEAKNKIVKILMSEAKNNFDFIPSISIMLTEIGAMFVFSSAKSGMIKGKNKAEIADNARYILKGIHENTMRLFERNFFSEEDE